MCSKKAGRICLTSELCRDASVSSIGGEGNLGRFHALHLVTCPTQAIGFCYSLGCKYKLHIFFLRLPHCHTLPTHTAHCRMANIIIIIIIIPK